MLIRLSIAFLLASFIALPPQSNAAEKTSAPVAKKTPSARPLTSKERIFLIKPSGYVNLGTYNVPGYYTLIVFSAAWCTPCAQVRSQAAGWLDKYPNLVLVDLDIGADSALDAKSSSILADLGREITLPAALLVNPFGVYMNAGKGDGIAPPFSGAEAIKSLMDNFDKRKHKEVVPFAVETKKRFLELKQMKHTGAAK